MGDCLLLTSPVRALKEEFPEFRISVVVEERFADCFAGNPDFDEIIAARGKSRTAARLFMRYFDAIINLHGGPTSLFYTFLPLGTRIGAEHYQGARLYNGRFPPPEPHLHTVESTMTVFRWMGLSSADAPPLQFARHTKAAERFEKMFKGQPYAVIHPASIMTTKRWPADRFATFAHWLTGEGLTVVLTAGPGEEPIVGEVAQRHPDTVMLLALTIPELAELIRGARLYVGNDSGPMHLATAVGTPTLAVWGSSDSRRWHPWGVEYRVVQNPFECNPCPGYRCLVADSPLCIESVTVEQVQAAAKQLLSVQR